MLDEPRINWLGEQRMLFYILRALKIHDSMEGMKNSSSLCEALNDSVDGFAKYLQHKDRTNGHMRQYDEVFNDAGYLNHGLRWCGDDIQRTVNIVKFTDITRDEWVPSFV